jgi:hypothetical protein
MFISLSHRSIAICANPNSKRAALEYIFPNDFFFQKNFLLTKKTGVPDLFSKPKFFFAICFLFDKRKKRSKMKNTIRERRYPERFSPYFLYFKIWWRDGVLHVPGNSQFVIIAHSNFIYNNFRMQLYKD